MVWLYSFPASSNLAERKSACASLNACAMSLWCGKFWYLPFVFGQPTDAAHNQNLSRRPMLVLKEPFSIKQAVITLTDF